MLAIFGAPDEPSFTAAPERPSTEAIGSTSRSGSAAVQTRFRGILLGHRLPKIRRRKAIGMGPIGGNCLNDALVDDVDCRARVADGFPESQR